MQLFALGPQSVQLVWLWALDVKTLEMLNHNELVSSDQLKLCLFVPSCGVGNICQFCE